MKEIKQIIRVYIILKENVYVISDKGICSFNVKFIDHLLFEIFEESFICGNPIEVYFVDIEVSVFNFVLVDKEIVLYYFSDIHNISLLEISREIHETR